MRIDHQMLRDYNQENKSYAERSKLWPIFHVSLIIILCCRGHCSVNSMDSPSEDVDVEMERQRLFGGRTGNDVLLLYNLRKCYGGFSKKNTAVENISLGIPRGEVNESFFFPFYKVTLYSEQLLKYTQCVYSEGPVDSSRKNSVDSVVVISGNWKIGNWIKAETLVVLKKICSFIFWLNIQQSLNFLLLAYLYQITLL